MDVATHIPTTILNRMRQEGTPINTFDMSNMGRSNDMANDEETNPDLNFNGIIPDDTDDSIRIVNDLNRDFFREKLVQHFYIRWERGDVFWPRKVDKT